MSFFSNFHPQNSCTEITGEILGQPSIITDVCKRLGLEKSRTTPYHPQSDGLVERFKRTLMDMLATAVSDHPFE